MPRVLIQTSSLQTRQLPSNIIPNQSKSSPFQTSSYPYEKLITLKTYSKFSISDFLNPLKIYVSCLKISNAFLAYETSRSLINFIFYL